MKFVFIATIVSVSFCFSGCEKESSVERGVVIPVVNNLVLDSNYLDKILKIQNYGGTSTDSSMITFKYDVQNRVETIIESNYNNVNDTFQVMKFFYLSNDTLPFRATVDNGAINFYFYYDNAGRLSRDSVIEYNTIGNNGYNYVTNFIYGNAKIFTVSTGNFSNNGPPSFVQIRDTIQTDARGNFLNSKTYDKDSLSGNFFLYNTTFSTFDNKLSPYTKVNGYKILILANQIPIEKPFAFSKNNLINEISSNYIIIGGVPTLNSTYQINYTNTYNARGFLNKHIKIEGTTTEKFEYFYKPL